MRRLGAPSVGSQRSLASRFRVGRVTLQSPGAFSQAAPPDAAERLLARYAPWRRWVEPLAWIAFFAINAVANSITVLMDMRRSHVGVADWEPLAWECSSNLLALLLVPAVVAFTRVKPLTGAAGVRRIALYFGASIAWSIVHVGGMVALRKLVYSALGAQYDFGIWWREWGYEYLKDARTFVGLVVVIAAYRLLLRRMQGEARLLATPDGVPATPVVERPERFLVRKLGKEFLILACDIEWLQASGNYVNLHVRGRDYPLRITMAQVSGQIDPARFRRVHRSYIVNLDHLERIEPADSGDARLVMRDGSELPCSRRYRPGLRTATAGAAEPGSRDAVSF